MPRNEPTREKSAERSGLKQQLQLTLSAVAAVALLASCVEFPSGPGRQPATGPVVGLYITIANRSPGYVLVGERVNVNVEAFTEAGLFVPASSVTYASADPSVATISSAGQLRGLRSGTVLLTIRSSGLTATVPVHVRANRCSGPLVTRTTSTDATLNDNVDLSSCALDEHGAAEGWRLTLGGPTTIAMVRAMGAENLELVVKDAAFATVHEEFSVLGTNLDRTRIVRTLAAGTYYLFVASAQFDSSAAFSIRVTPRVACTASTATVPAVADGNYDDAFGPTSCVLPDGRSAAQWVVQATARTLFAVQSVGRGASVYPEITGPDGRSVWSYQSVAQGDSGVLNVFEVGPGRNVLWIASWDSDTANTAFTAAVRVPQVCAADASFAELVLGDTLRSLLNVGGCLRQPDSFRLSQPYTVNVANPGTIQYDLITTEFNGVQTFLRNTVGDSVPVSVEFLSPGTLRHTASVSPGVWQVLVAPSWGYTPDADFALLLKSLPQ